MACLAPQLRAEPFVGDELPDSNLILRTLPTLVRDQVMHAFEPLSPKRLLAPHALPVEPLSDASDQRQRDERGRSRSYCGDTSDRVPPPPGPNRALTGPRRPVPPAGDADDDDDDNNNRPPYRRSAVNEFGVEALTSSSSEASGSNSEAESDFRTPLETTLDDDDVPLAVAHPTTALAAQKSLRLDRRKEKSAERSRRKAERRRIDSPPSRRRTGPGASNLSLPQESRRQPKDLPSAYGVSSMDGVFRAEDLERKLRELEQAAKSNSRLAGDSTLPHPHSRLHSITLSPSLPGSARMENLKGSSMPPPILSRKASASNLAMLPPSLSRKASASNLAMVPPSLSRKASATALGLAPPLPPMGGQGSLLRARSQSASKPTPPAPPSREIRQLSATRPHSPTQEPTAASMQRKGSEPLPGEIGRKRSHPSARRPSTKPADVPPLPPLPGSSTNFPSPNLASSSTQQSSAAMSRRPTLNGLGPLPELERLRISSQPARMLTVSLEHGDVAKMMRLEVPESMTAGGLLELLKAKGDLPTGRSGESLLKGELAVWERGDEWAVERPLRDYEVLGQVLTGWNPAKRENLFVIKRCSLCECLTLRAIPNQCPNVVGWVQIYSTRKKKWSKRYLEVRGGGVSLAKNERGKDEQHLCSLTAYDFYLVTKVPAKAPKGSYFALKSQDQSAFFEDASDFIHLFATDSRTFDRMYRGILDARSHSLSTTNPQLFSTLSPTSAASRGPLSAVSPVMADLVAFGAGTYGSIRRPSAGSAAQATVSSVVKPHDGLWQQGSLLSKMTRAER